MSAPIVSFINMKGGVGKTTLCVSIADYLAHFANKKILVIDVDPQFNASQTFLWKYGKIKTYLDDLQPKKKTIRHVLDLSTTLVSTDDELSPSDIITKMTDNLDIILGDLDIIFDQNNEARRVNKLRDFIEDNQLKEEYDYILIDSPPTISMFTDTALLASDYYLTPSKIDYYSAIGALNLISVVKSLNKDYKHNIVNLGFVYTNTQNTLSKKTIATKDKFESDISSDLDSNCYIFTAKLSYVHDLMVGSQGNIASAYSRSRNDIKMITHEFMERIDCLRKCDDEK